MRPALLRLLRRPFAVSTLDTLAATSIGIEQLEIDYTRLRGQPQCLRHYSSINDARAPPAERKQWPRQRTPDKKPTGKRRPLSFPIHEIEIPTDTDAIAPPPPPPSDKPYSENERTLDTPAKALRLHPERLEFESNVGHTHDLGTRLVDQPEHSSDFELWEELLHHRQRKYGDQGTQEIWEGMTVRLQGVQLPVTGPRADFFWRCFVGLGLRREIYLTSVLEHAIDIYQRQGISWPHLYESVVGKLLDQGRTRQASALHRMLQRSGLAQPNDVARVLKQVFHPACLPISEDPATLIISQRQTIAFGQTALKAMCRCAPGHRIYGPVISHLMQNGYGEYALKMHEFLVRHDDHPQTAEEMLDLWEYVKKHGSEREFNAIRDYAEEREFEKFNTDTSMTDETASAGHKKEKGGKRYNDDIGAKLISTPPFNLEWVIGTLKMLGVSAIGPRTIREVTIRANSSKEILDRINLIRGSGITIEDSIFPRLVEKLAKQHRSILLSDLLHSDQHPDVLADVKIQESFLVSHYMAQDWRQYNLALAVLAEHFPSSSGLLDLHFRKHIAAGEYDAASKVVDEVAIHGQKLSEESVDFLAQKVLTSRQQTKGPSPGKPLSAKDEVMFVFRVLQRVVPAGSYVSAPFWVELLKRLGMDKDWDEFSEMCHWLVHEYSFIPHAEPSLFPSKLQPTGRDGRILSQIFSTRMQVAIVSWGFRPRIDENVVGNKKNYYKDPTTGQRYMLLVRGIVLLRDLRNAGVKIEVDWVRRATRHRLATLFSEYSPSARRVNRRLRLMCPFTLHEVVAEAKRAWGDEFLFRGHERSRSPRWLANPYRTRSSLRRSSNVVIPRREMGQLRERARRGDSRALRQMREWQDLRERFPPKPRRGP
ncbi:hypothetical protein N7509_000982 [Penicillium cosmopolitanum]|uniref:Pentatricopeptide repeat domain-containing protein n=1 Tax=Penicillium cosmopolitanum TaxID=1131564 RepID=A0A9W9WBA2_9EURO|nr:uncharacterized protein N7509_000982 [Penicillium cosmopolitanum]KAJ5414355.1 hypothetical protein N7509_000982 [Penicillium cosmopolitanum]